MDLEKCYDYTDEQVTLLFQVVRTKDKRFFQRRRINDTEWVYSLASGLYVRDDRGRWSKTESNVESGAVRLPDCRRVIYQLPSIRAAIASGKTIFIVEGEKDVESLANIGLRATCNPGGAGKWLDCYTAQLAGAKRIVVIPDNDLPGRDHAKQVIGSLTVGLKDCEVHILDLPVPPKEDATYFLEHDGSRDRLLGMATGLPWIRQEADPPATPPLGQNVVLHNSPEGVLAGVRSLPLRDKLLVLRMLVGELEEHDFENRAHQERAVKHVTS